MFTPVDRASWPRRQAFWYYTEAAPTAYSITCRVEVTNARRALKDAGLRFFPAYLWLVTEAISHQSALRLAERDGVPGHWNQLVPAYPRLCREDGSTALLWTEHRDSFRAFHEAYLGDCARYPARGDLLTEKGRRRKTATSSPAFPGSPLTASLFKPSGPRGTFSPASRRAPSRNGMDRCGCPCPSPPTTPPRTAGT